MNFSTKLWAELCKVKILLCFCFAFIRWLEQCSLPSWAKLCSYWFPVRSRQYWTESSTLQISSASLQWVSESHRQWGILFLVQLILKVLIKLCSPLLLQVVPEDRPSQLSPRSDACSAFTVVLSVRNYRSCKLWRTVYEGSLTYWWKWFKSVYSSLWETKMFLFYKPLCLYIHVLLFWYINTLF